MTEEETKARYDETDIITLTPNCNDWSGNFTLKTEHPFKLREAVYLGARTDANWRDTDVGANGGRQAGELMV